MRRLLPFVSRFLALVLSLAAVLPAAALDLGRRTPLATDMLLPADEAFPLVAAERDGHRVRLSWVIAPGYYLYRDRFGVETVDGTALTLVLPDGTAAQDEHFGEVRIFTVAVEGHVVLPVGAEPPTRLKLRWQGCAEAGVCYPPLRREVTLSLTER